MKTLKDEIFNEISLKNRIISGPKAWLSRLQLFFEKETSLRNFIYSLLLFLGVLCLVLLYLPTKEFVYWASRVIVSFCVIFFIVIDNKHVLMIVKMRQELDSRKEIIKQFLDSIEPVYMVESWEENHLIRSTGDGIYVCKIKLKYYGKNIYWYQLSFSSTDSEYHNDKKFHVSAKDLKTNRNLSRVTYDFSISMKKTIIILDPPLSELNPTADILIYVKWPGIWEQFITKGKDTGNVRITHPVENLSVNVFFEEGGYDLSGFVEHPGPNITSRFSKNKIEIKAKNPEMGSLTYHFEIDKGQ
jgi:hypothetical protein